MRILLILLVLMSISFSSVSAQIRSEIIEYKQGDTVMEGYLAYDDSIKGKRPGILVIHDWTGVGSYVRARSQQLASLGYIAFAPDIYGKNIRPADNEAAAKISGELKNDRLLLRLRVNAGLDILRNHPLTDADKLGAIGYCFGGMSVLELARSGAKIAGVVSFHGNLDASAETNAIHTKVLVLHGAEDPVVPPPQITAFEDEMRKAGVDWQLNVYSGAAHNFTNPSSPAYNRQTDKRSFEAMKDFFTEIFDS